MNRRDLLKITAAVSLAPLLPVRAAQAQALAYAPGMVEQRLAAGETLFVDFKASWCTTCAAQDRVIAALKAENPAYAAGITFIDVDWDLYAEDALTLRLGIPRRSTLVVLKGQQELGRLVAVTGRDEIRALMDTALAAATA
jgi:thiol-disulfide isomerase/thioredoxin